MDIHYYMIKFCMLNMTAAKTTGKGSISLCQQLLDVSSLQYGKLRKKKGSLGSPITYYFKPAY